MIPILFSPFDRSFTTNGVGRLTECTSCVVTEERNGIYECEFVYPINGTWYNQLLYQGGIVGCIHDDHHDIQPFVIYRHSDPIDGLVTFNAHHISYELGNVIVEPFDADTCADALQGFVDHAVTEQRFSFWTDKSVSADFTLDRMANVRELLAGQKGSILDVYGKGEYEFDKYTVKLYVNRGLNRGVTIRYGKNLADINRTYDESSVYNAIAPYWTDGQGTTVTLPEGYVANTAGVIKDYPWEYEINGAVMTDHNGTVIEFRPFNLKAVPMDFSDQFEEQPTEQQLRDAANAYLTNNEPWIPSDNITVDFVQLWQTTEYENVAALQRVSLCDTVGVFYPELGVTNASAKVIKIVYNVLTEQYDEMELGDAKTGIIDTISDSIEMRVSNELAQERAFMETAIAHATDMITGGLGGYVVMNLNASGQPQEILIMDTDDINTAVNVIRMNKNGIGFSQTGYEGPFTSAWTIDGAFNADFITAGTMLANRIYGGTLTIGGQNNASGVIVVKDASNVDVGRWNNAGIRLPITNDINDYALFSKTGLTIKMGDGFFKTELATVGTATAPYLQDYYTYAGETVFTGINPCIVSLSRSGGGTSYNIQLNLIRSDFKGIVVGNGSDFVSMSVDGDINATGDTIITGNFTVAGTKSREVKTKEYSKRLLYCYETSSPLFGDVGEGVIDETGFCYVFLDPVFAETISTIQYQVFLQKYGDGDCWVAERKAGHFVVQGTAGMRFGWELKAKQKDFDQKRLDISEEKTAPLETDYGELAAEFIYKLQEGREAA